MSRQAHAIGKNRNSGKKQSRASALFEPLEQRRLMTVTYGALTGFLTVTGTTGNDTISVAPTTNGVGSVQVRENGVLTYTVTSVRPVSRISITGGDGHDNIAVSVNVPTIVDGGNGNDTISTGSANDQIDGWIGNDVIRGGGGHDLLYGFADNDTIHGEEGNDTIYAEGGRDYLYGGNGSDALSGGGEVDWVGYSDRTTGVMITLDNVANDGSYTNAPSLPDQIDPFVSTEFDNVQSDIENISTGSGNDIITARESDNIDNRIICIGGHDVVSAGGGNDWIDCGEGNDNAGGGSGNDTVYGGTGADAFSGSTGNDLLVGGSENDTMFGDEGLDTLDGGTGADQFHGGADNDTADYSSRSQMLRISLDGVANDGAAATTTTAAEGDNVRSDVEIVRGGSNNDIITAPASSSVNNTFYGNGGNDTLDGGGGNDSLWGSSGNDSLLGNVGNDSVFGDAGDDMLGGGGGQDHLYGDVGHDSLTGGDDRDTLWGNIGNDTLDGGTGDDELYGEDGHDNLYGDAGWDTLNGGAGNDGLAGGQNYDHITGGPNNDRFLDRSWTGAWGATTWEDNVTDRLDSEARIGFRNGQQVTNDFAGQSGDYTFAAGSWTDADVKLIDSALAPLHLTKSSATLLRDADGDDMKFIRHGATLSEPADATGTVAGWNSGDSLSFPDDAFAAGANSIRETVFHEFGHNWDTEFNPVGWRALSGWTTTNMSGNANFVKGLDEDDDWWYLATAPFASGYAKTNPQEDFAESFAEFFMRNFGFTTSLNTVASKNAFIANMVNTLP